MTKAIVVTPRYTRPSKFGGEMIGATTKDRIRLMFSAMPLNGFGGEIKWMTAQN
jgi:hypothetical protein